MSLWGNTDVAGSLPKYLQVGRILKINVTAGGTGYTNGDAVAVTIGAPGTGGIQATATAKVVGGIVESITITNPGTRYATAPAVTMATGTGLTTSVVLEPIVYDSRQIVFVDATEAAQESNKMKGITGAGWWLHKSYQDQVGDTRYKSELLIAMTVAAATSGDASDDATVPDTSTLITIGTQPASQTISLAVATQAVFTVAATVAPSGTATYQWQVSSADSNRYTDISGETSATLTVTGLDETFNGNKYRAKVSATGAPVRNSAVATLTVTE